MNRIVSAVLGMVVVLSLVHTRIAYGQSCPVQDDQASSRDHWAYQAIAELAAKGIIEYESGHKPLDRLLQRPDAIDTNGDGKKDTYVSHSNAVWWGRNRRDGRWPG